MKQLTFSEYGSGYAAEFTSEGAVVVQLQLADKGNASVRARLSKDMNWCVVDVIDSAWRSDLMFAVDLPEGVAVQIYTASKVTKGVLL